MRRPIVPGQLDEPPLLLRSLKLLSQFIGRDPGRPGDGTERHPLIGQPDGDL